MQAKSEFRRSDRLGYEYIIKLEDDLTLSPYYAVSYNLSETGMYFKSLFELRPGAHILIRMDDYTLSRNQVPATVVWCKPLENKAVFRYGIGVKFSDPGRGFSVNTARPVSAPAPIPDDKDRSWGQASE